MNIYESYSCIHMLQIKNSCNLLGSINAEKFRRNLAGCVTDTMQVYGELEEVIFHRA